MKIRPRNVHEKENCVKSSWNFFFKCSFLRVNAAFIINLLCRQQVENEGKWEIRLLFGSKLTVKSTRRILFFILFCFCLCTICIEIYSQAFSMRPNNIIICKILGAISQKKDNKFLDWPFFGIDINSINAKVIYLFIYPLVSQYLWTFFNFYRISRNNIKKKKLFYRKFQFIEGHFSSFRDCTD